MHWPSQTVLPDFCPFLKAFSVVETVDKFAVSTKRKCHRVLREQLLTDFNFFSGGECTGLHRMSSLIFVYF